MESDDPPLISISVRYKPTTDPRGSQLKARSEKLQVNRATSVRDLQGLIRQKFSNPAANVMFYRDGRPISLDRSDRALRMQDLMAGQSDKDEISAEVDDGDGMIKKDLLKSIPEHPGYKICAGYEDWECEICRRLCVHPIYASCGEHMFCRDRCLLQDGKESGTCAVCNTAWSSVSELIPVASNVRKRIWAAEIVCSQCGAKMKFGDNGATFDHHVEAECPIECVNSRWGCSATHLTRDSIVNHLEEECPFFPCSNISKQCDWRGKVDYLAQHLETECQFEPTSCPEGCGVIVTRSNLKNHLQSCKVALKRRRIEEHKAQASLFDALRASFNPPESEMIALNISGTKFRVSKAALTKYPQSLLAFLYAEHSQSRLQLDSSGAVNIDRPAAPYHFILAWCQTGVLASKPDEYLAMSLLTEIMFLKLNEMSHAMRTYLLSGLNLPAQNFSGMDLRGYNLAGSKMQDANFSKAILSGTNMKSCDLQNAILSGADLSGADLTNANLAFADLEAATVTNAKLDGCILSGCNMRGIDLSGTDLRGFDLHGANLSNANFNNAKLNGCVLVGCILSGVDLSGRDLSGFDLSHADLSGANLAQAKFRGCTLTGANLSGVDLSGQDLSGLDLHNVNLSGANLTSANLSNANFTGANLSGAELKNAAINHGCKLSGANLTGVDLSERDLSRFDLSNANLTNANLANANLNNANLSDAKLSNANLRGCKMVGTNLNGVNFLIPT